MKIFAVLAVSGLLVLGVSAQEATTTTTTTTTRYQLCSAIHGARISTSDSQEVGTIDDLLIDPREGRIVTIITSVDNKLIPVPWTAVTVGEDLKVITVNTTRERLIAAPTIERTQIATFSPELFQRSDAFFRESVSRTGNNLEGRPGMSPGERNDMNARTGNNVPDENGRNSNANTQNNENRREKAAARNSDQQAQPGSSPALNNRRTAERNNGKAARQPGEKRRDRSNPDASASPEAMTTPADEKSSGDKKDKREKSESRQSQSPSANSAVSPSEKMPDKEKQTNEKQHLPGERKAAGAGEAHESPPAREATTPKEAGPQ